MNPEINRIARLQIGEFIQTLIKDRGLVIDNVSKQTGMSKRIIYNIIQGKGYTVDSLLTLCKYLKINVIINIC